MRTTEREAPDERGAVAPVAALLMTVMLLCVALVVDIGMQRVGRADMQALADVVALDLARELDGRNADQLSAVVDGLVEKSVARNAANLGDPPDVDAELGRVGTDGTFAVVTGGTRVTAVRVTAATDVPFAFEGLTGTSQGAVSRPAVATASSFACYKLGSWAASLATGDSVLLDPVLQQMAQASGAFSDGGAVRALSYTGLANATVELGDLAAQLGIGSVTELASARVDLKRYLTALKVLAQPSNATTVSILNTLATTAKPGVLVDVAKLVAVDSGSVSALDATANVLDLVGGAVSLVNGTNTAYVYLGSTLPSLTSANLQATLTQGPRQYCGGPGSVTAQTAQLTAQVGGQLNPVTINGFNPAVPGLLGNVVRAEITAQNYVTFSLSAAQARSRLSSISCDGARGVDVSVESGLATVTVETPLRGEIRGDLLNLGLPLLGSLVSSRIAIDATVKVVVTVSPSGTSTVSIRVPPRAYDTPYATPGGGISLAPATIAGGFNVTANQLLLGGAIGGSISLNVSQKNQIITSFINAGLASLFSPSDPRSLANTVIKPMLKLAGLSIGGANVILDSTPALTCSRPRLVG